MEHDARPAAHLLFVRLQDHDEARRMVPHHAPAGDVLPRVHPQVEAGAGVTTTLFQVELVAIKQNLEFAKKQLTEREWLSLCDIVKRICDVELGEGEEPAA